MIVRDVRDLLDLYGTTDEQQRERLLGLARESRQRGWWAEFGSWLPSGFDTYAGMEAAAASVRAYQAQLVHGLLQTEDYARAVLRALRPEDARESVEKLIQFRMARQAQLTRAENRLRLWVIFEEEALKRPVGGEPSCKPSFSTPGNGSRAAITIQVLPTARGAHAGLDGSFALFEFPERGDRMWPTSEGRQARSSSRSIEEVGRFAGASTILRAAPWTWRLNRLDRQHRARHVSMPRPRRRNLVGRQMPGSGRRMALKRNANAEMK